MRLAPLLIYVTNAVYYAASVAFRFDRGDRRIPLRPRRPSYDASPAATVAFRFARGDRRIPLRFMLRRAIARHTDHDIATVSCKHDSRISDLCAA